MSAESWPKPGGVKASGSAEAESSPGISVDSIIETERWQEWRQGRHRGGKCAEQTLCTICFAILTVPIPPNKFCQVQKLVQFANFVEISDVRHRPGTMYISKY